MVPLGFKVKPVGVAVFQVSVTELMLGFGTPFNLSFVSTLEVVPPVVLLTVATSSLASIVVGVVVLVVVPVTVTTMLAVSHTVVLATAQIL